jgi:hypothetical protein
MALNIPLPGLPGDTLRQAATAGSGIYSRIMQPILERERLKQAEEHFKQNLALRKAAAGRAGANSDLHRLIIQEQLKALHRKNNPIEAYQELLKAYQGLGGEGEQEMPEGSPQQQNWLQALTVGQEPQQPFEGQGLMNGIPQGSGTLQNPEGNLRTFGAEDFLQNPEIEKHKKKEANNPFGIDLKDLQKQLFYHSIGLKPPVSHAAGALHGPARDAADLERLRKEEGENSPVYQNAKNAYEAQSAAKQDLRDIRGRAKAGLKSGETLFYDPKSGVPLGKEIPLTAKERESEEGNILFNELYPLVYKGASPFSGEGSIRRLEKAASVYKTDPKARKLFDDYLLADKALAATVVNEASTLKSGKTNSTYAQLRESLQAQDIPKLVKKLIKEYKIPASASLKAGMRYQEALSNARKKARKSTPATQKLFFNPEMQTQYEQKKERNIETKNEDNKKASNEVLVIDPDGNQFKTTKENAAYLPKGWRNG